MKIIDFVYSHGEFSYERYTNGDGSHRTINLCE